MVAHFKLYPGQNPVHQISQENVERFLGRRYPWLQEDDDRGHERHFAVCPYCDNPVQIKGLYRRNSKSTRPYGSHTGKVIEGFTFNNTDLAFCPYRLPRQGLQKNTLRSPGPISDQLIRTAIEEFDRIILILRDDFGFHFSNRFALQMLEQWITSKGYLYVGSHLRNLPWMIAYFAPAQSLFGQPVGLNADLAKNIQTMVPAAQVTTEGILSKGKSWFRIDLQCLLHKSEVNDESGQLIERLTMRVQDFSKTNDPGQAPTIYTKLIMFTPNRFEALIHSPVATAKRNTTLLSAARDLAVQKGLSHVIA